MERHRPATLGAPLQSLHHQFGTEPPVSFWHRVKPRRSDKRVSLATASRTVRENSAVLSFHELVVQGLNDSLVGLVLTLGGTNHIVVRSQRLLAEASTLYLD